MIDIFFPGTPVAQGRPKFSTKGGFARAYDPAKSRNYKAFVAAYAQQKGIKPLEGALTMLVCVYLKRPASVSAKKRPYPTVKPDCSNYLKGIEDALNGIAYHDDSQIIEVKVYKFYEEPEGIKVLIEEVAK